MRKILTTGVIVSVASLFIVGCGGSSDPLTSGEKLVGTWTKGCYKPTGDNGARYRTATLTFTKDNTFKFEKIKYSDEKCTQDPETYKKAGTYKVGKDTKDSNNKEATEIDYTKGSDKFYSMFKFLKSGNLVFANKNDAEGRDGSTPEKRANYFDSSWTGFSKK